MLRITTVGCVRRDLGNVLKLLCFLDFPTAYTSTGTSTWAGALFQFCEREVKASSRLRLIGHQNLGRKKGLSIRGVALPPITDKGFGKKELGIWGYPVNPLPCAKPITKLVFYGLRNISD